MQSYISSVEFGLSTDCHLQADWEDMNRKSSKFEALQLIADGDNDDDDNDDDNDDNAMVDDSAPKSRESKPARVMQNPVADDHTGNDEDEEIT